MREFDRIGLNVPEVSIERVDLRCPISKTHLLPTGELNYQTANSLIHFGNSLDDINLEPIDNGATWLVVNAPYKLEVDKAAIKYIFTSLDGTTVVTVELVSIDGYPSPNVDCLSVGESLGNSLSFDQVIGDGSVSIIAKPDGVSTQQFINSDSGRCTLLWKVTQNTPQPIVIETSVRARDAEDQEAEITITRSSLAQNPDGTYSGTFSEYATGKILVILDKSTRVKTPADGLVYPLIVVS